MNRWRSRSRTARAPAVSPEAARARTSQDVGSLPERLSGNGALCQRDGLRRVPDLQGRGGATLQSIEVCPGQAGLVLVRPVLVGILCQGLTAPEGQRCRKGSDRSASVAGSEMPPTGLHFSQEALGINVTAVVRSKRVSPRTGQDEG